MAQKMIKGALMVLLVATVSLVTAVVSANAQSSRRAVATVPFDFAVGDQKFTAGRYEVSSVTAGSDAIQVRGIAATKSAIRLSTAIVKFDATPRAKLVFRRYGNSYFLSEVWGTGYATGRKLVKSGAERALESELAANKQRYERVEIALVRE